MTQDEDRIVEACQSRVYQLWNYDSYPDDNKAAAQKIIIATFNVFGVELEDPWDQ